MKITKELVVDKIREWEMDAGESFFDNGLININPLTFMTWCYGKGYLTYEQYNNWTLDFSSNKLKAIDENYYIYNQEGEYGAQFAVVISEEYNDEDYEKALLIFGEFVEGNIVYQARFKEFLKGFEGEIVDE